MERTCAFCRKKIEENDENALRVLYFWTFPPYEEGGAERRDFCSEKCLRLWTCEKLRTNTHFQRINYDRFDPHGITRFFRNGIVSAALVGCGNRFFFMETYKRSLEHLQPLKVWR